MSCCQSKVNGMSQYFLQKKLAFLGINTINVMAFREIGCVHELIKMFSTIMESTQPVNINAYNAINKLMEAANKSMNNAAQNVRALEDGDNNLVTDIQFPLMARGKSEAMIHLTAS